MPVAPRVRKPNLGVVFSLHGNGMAVVDFLGNWGMDPSPKSVEMEMLGRSLSGRGYECPTFDLEVVEETSARAVFQMQCLGDVFF